MNKRFKLNLISILIFIFLIGVLFFSLRFTLSVDQEEKLFEIFRIIYLPLIILYKRVGLIGSLMLGISAIFLSILGIVFSQSKLKFFFVFLLLYLLGPVFLFIWTEYLEPYFFK